MTLALAAWAGVAAAVSSGGYNPDQQDCPWNADNSQTTGAGSTYQGCHNLAVNVESGGQTNGDPSSTNRRYVEYGGNELPNTNEPATPTVLGIGYPGQDNSQHAGCIAFDTNGTGGGGSTGCGSGGGGLGFSTTYDYFNTIQPAYTYQPVPFVDPFSVIGGNPQLGTMPAPVPDPTGTQVKGGSPVSPQLDTNAGGVTPGSGSVLDTFLSQGLIVYFGMDDNNDAGEHDGVSGTEFPCASDPTKSCGTAGTVNGPSDGGGMVLSLEPQWLMNGGGTPTASHPEGLANYTEGECADGICSEITTQQQTVYYGCGATNPQNDGTHDQCTTSRKSGNVYENDTPSSTQEPFACSSGDLSSENCNGGGLDQFRQGTPSQMNAEPGVQTYQDPDPQRSPAAPFGTPGTYVGTCGLYVNDSGGYSKPGITGLLTGGNFTAPAGYVVQNPTDPACN